MSESSGVAARLLRFAEALSSVSGRAVAWLTLAMVALTFLVVVLRYLFALGWIWLQELSVWLHALVFLLAAAYTLQHDEHVRVDLFYRKLPAERRALIDLAGTLLLLFPTCIFLLYVSVPYALESWVRAETSRETGGLPYPFVPLAKSAIPLSCVLLMVQGFALALRAWMVCRGQLPPPAVRGGSREL